MDPVPFELYLVPALLAPIFLAWGADRVVDGASALSFNLGMSPLLIGVLVMGFGTSLPELLVSLFSSVMGNSGLSLGNAYGSNIINIGFVLGLAAVLSPVVVKRHVVRRELPLLILATGITAFLVMDFELSRNDGMILLVLFVAVLVYLILASRHEPARQEDSGLKDKLEKRGLHLAKSVNYLIIGLGVIVLCSASLVWSARGIVVNLGVSELVVGVVILALGTSLPELVVVVVAVRAAADGRWARAVPGRVSRSPAAMSALFAVLRDRGGIAGQFAASLGGAIWGLVTFLVVVIAVSMGFGWDDVSTEHFS